MSSSWLRYALTLLAAVSSWAIFLALRNWLSPQAEPDSRDLTQLTQKDAKYSTAFGGLNPRGSIIDRLDFFLLKTFRLGAKLEEMHTFLGRPAKPSPLNILHLKELIAAAFAAAAWFGTGSVILALAIGALGFIFPDVFINRRIRERQRRILGDFPPMVDLAALTLEAGLDYLTAFDRIIKSSAQKGPLEAEVGTMLDEVSLGYSRRDALTRLAQRVGVQEIRSFVSLIIQSDELGTSLVDLLRNYATDMRFRRLSRAEKLAAQASTKMLLPLIIFIFPTVFIMMLSPMIKSLITGGLGF
ncbi:MAG: type II secretion system F family protein [Elusimicrobiota bacterium]